MLMAALNGFMDYIPESHLKDPPLAFSVLERYFREGDLSPNEPFPGENFFYWHYFYHSFMMMVTTGILASFSVSLSFFSWGPTQESSSLTWKEGIKRVRVRATHSKDRTLIKNFDVTELPVYLAPWLEDCVRDGESEVSLETMVQQRFPNYKYLQDAIEWMLLRDGPITAEHRKELNKLFGKELKEIISRAS
ncbi:hypothetical protein BDV12DRAFT_196803 [Aspergillus spectabilis]